MTTPLTTHSARTWVEVDLRRLEHNWSVLRTRARACGQALLPMLKANAYGHGAIVVARRLLDSPEPPRAVGVASVEEGEALRRGLSAKARDLEIVVFSDAWPLTREHLNRVQASQLTLVLSRLESVTELARAGWLARLRYRIECNTGMNRLGVELNSARELIRCLERLKRPERELPRQLFSHLAAAESPTALITRRQLARYDDWRRLLATPRLASLSWGLGNSAALWNAGRLGLSARASEARPGLALYGVEPWPGADAQVAPASRLRPVLSWGARVADLRRLAPGESVGYGATYRVPARGGARWLATVSVGYGDGVPRALGNQGALTLASGANAPIRGRVSMDLLSVEVPRDSLRSARVGAEVWLLPRQASGTELWAYARAAGTIPYEILTSIGGRVQRIHVGD